ncbi:MAG: hypothetical protein AB7T06_31645 [Kofleriaceae bacterium]
MKAVVLAVLAALAMFACSSSSSSDDRAKRADRAISIEVTVGGNVATWTRATLSSVPRTIMSADAHNKWRQGWSLRRLAKELVGPTARVARVMGSDRETKIDANAWADLTRTPVVHVTDEGTLSFRWAAADETWGDVEVHEVTALEIVQ